MSLMVRKERRDIVQRNEFGVPTYLQQIFNVTGLSLQSPELTDEEILTIARTWENLNNITHRDRIPQTGESRLGMRLRYIRVDQIGDSGSERRILCAWGFKFTVFPSTKNIRVVPSGTQTMIQPYMVIKQGTVGDQAVSFFEQKQRQIQVGRIQYYLGKILSSSLSQMQIAMISASNVNRLYELDDQPGIPILHRGVQFVDWRNGQTWIWTIFETTGWVRAKAENEIEPGSLPVAELRPLEEYVEKPISPQGTGRRVAEDIYGIGDVLPW